jgi:phytoene dehydrogenase-like protein
VTSRRDVLQLFLGAPLAVAACKRAAPPAAIAGALVPSLEDRGHRIRDEGPVSIPAVTGGAEGEAIADVLVVGGGVAGLAARERLAREGLRVVLVEADDVLGGTAKAGSNAGGSFPWGAHYVTAPLVEAKPIVRLLRELGVVDGLTADGRDVVVAEEAIARAPEERLFHLGRWEDGLYPRAGASADDLAQLERFRAKVRALAERRDSQGRRAFIAPLAFASTDADVLELDRITMEAWLEREGLTSPRLRWLVDYACRDDFGLRLAHTSAWAALFYFAARTGPDGEPREVIPWPEGNGRLVRHLAAKGRGEVLLGHLVRRVAPWRAGQRDEGASAARAPARDGVVAVVEDRDGVRRAIRARHAVIAVPRFVANRVVDGLAARGPAEASPSYGSWVVANLVVRRELFEGEAPLAWDSVIHKSPSLGYVNARHQLDARSSRLAITHYYALCDEDPKAVREKLLAIDHARWCDVVLADLEAPHPRIREHVERIDVLRWGHAMVRPVPGVRTAAARGDACRPHGCVHFAHTELSGVALFEEAYAHGLRAAEEILTARGATFTSEFA